MESGSGNPAAYSPEIAESLRFEEQIQSLMSPPGTATSFTALLGLDFESVPLPIFPSNAELVDKAARFSAFAEGEVKAEKEDSGGDRNLAGKRKEVEKSKGSAKKKSKKKTAEENSGDDQKQLPYVHVRARRGQATDNHSLAERARREKINARMKLLQELVPGCSKISGTALVLEETINHVQALQRQVEFLSMKLAGVSPVVDFNGLGIDNCFSTECGRLMAGNGTIEQLPWLNGMLNQMKLPQQIWVMDQHHTEQQEQHKQQSWEGNDSHQSHVFINNPSSGTSIFCYDSSTPNSVSLANQLKTEVSLPDQLKTEL